LVALGAELQKLHEVAIKIMSLMVVARNRDHHPSPTQVDKLAVPLAAEIQDLTRGIGDRLKEFRYPFVHARGELSVAEYANPANPASPEEWQRAYAKSDACVDRLFTLYSHIQSALLVHAARGEAFLESYGGEAIQL